MVNLTELLQKQEEMLLELSKRLENLESRLSKLEKPSLMYRRPLSNDYETLSTTLDYLHNNVEGIKKDLAHVAKVV